MDEIQATECGRKWSVKTKGRVYKACVRPAIVCGGETCVMRKDEYGVLQRAKTTMVRMCGVKLRIGLVVWS